MPKLHSIITACTTAALTLLAANAAVAQGGRWFRVELLIFAHESATADAAEHWDPTPPLRYPGAARFLIDPAQVKSNRARYPGLGDVDEYGRQVLDTLSIAAPDYSNINTGDGEGYEQGQTTGQLVDPDTGLAVGPAQGPTNTAAALPAEQGSALNSRAFVTLPSGQLQFRGKAGLMRNSGRYSILFHESWLQPVVSKARTLPIILDQSGNTGEWSRLQGSITLYLSRYLHLETNLWLNTDGNYLAGNWKMPAPPLAPPSLIIEEQATGPVDPADVWIYEPGLAPVVAPGEGQQPAAEPAIIEADLYPYRHAVLLQQKRRMRSKEVHYIDHPKFGIVILITPVTSDDQAALAPSAPRQG